jgi:uncharacterized protein
MTARATPFLAPVRAAADAGPARPLTTELVMRLADVPADRLSVLCAGRSFYVGSSWLRTVEAIRGRRTGYIVCREAAGPVRGVLPLYWDDPVGRGFYSPYDMFLAPSGGRFSREHWSPTCVVGSRTAYEGEFLVDPGLSQAGQDAVLAAMLAAADEHATAVGAASLSALYLNARGADQLSRVVGPGMLFLAAANAVLELPGPGFDDYAGSLGRKRAGSIRHERSVFAAAGYELTEGKLEEVVDDIAGLFAALEVRHGHESSAAVEAAELRLMAATCGRESHVLGARLDGRMIGAVLMFVSGDVVYVRSTGFDYGVAGRAFEYFNLVYYETVEFALREDCRRVEFGITAYQAKLARGARLRPLLGFIYSDSALPPLADAVFAGRDRVRREAVNAEDGRCCGRPD